MFFLGGVLALFVSFHATVVGAEQVNFRQAIERALKNSPDYNILLNTEKMNQLTYKNSWSAFLPELDAEATNGFYRQGGNAVFSQTTSPLMPSPLTPAPVNPWSNLLALNIQENLYDNGKSWNEMDVANLNRQIGHLNSLKGAQQLMLTVSQSYYDYSAAMRGLQLQREEIDSLRQQFRMIEGRYHNGVSSNRDFLRIKAQLQRSEVDLATQEIAVETTRQTLRVAIGEREALDFIPLEPDKSAIAAVRAEDVLPESTFEFQVADLNERISDIHVREAQRENWPRLSLKGTYSYNIPQYVGAQTPGVDSPYWNLQAMLVLDYAIWDWGIRRRNVEIAESQREIDKNTQEKSRLTVRQDLNRLKTQMAFYLKSYHETEQILRDEEEVFGSLNRGYREAKVTYLELITALGELYAVRNQYVNLQFSLLKARANFGYYQGKLDEMLGLH